MAKVDTEQQETQLQELERESNGEPETALAILAPAEIAAQMPPVGFDDFDAGVLADLDAEIDKTLKQISVTEFKGARAFIGQDLTLLDAFPFQMQEDDKQRVGQKITVEKVMLVVADVDGVVHNVMQNANPSRERYIQLYQRIKARNVATGQNVTFSLTHVTFQEVGRAIAGNKPIILAFTHQTQRLWGRAVDNVTALTA